MNWFRKALTPQKPIVQLEAGESLKWQRAAGEQTPAFPAVMILNMIGLAVVFIGGGLLTSMFSGALPASIGFLAPITSVIWLLAVATLFIHFVRVMSGWGHACSLTNRRVLQHDQKNNLIRQHRWPEIGEPVLKRHPIVRSVATIRLPIGLNLTTFDVFLFQKIYNFCRGDMRIIGINNPDHVMDIILSTQQDASITE